MPSPFPGMDPYLEPHWLDVHTKLVAYSADALNNALPTDLIASTEERIAIEGREPEERWISPDVRIFEPPEGSPRLIEEDTVGGVAMLPFRLLAQMEPIIERYIKIVNANTERVITVIEFVSPTNKRGPGLHAFRMKRGELVASGVNFVEIDLVRAGDWRALLKPHQTKQHSSLYRATIRLPQEPDVVQFQPIPLREKLPKLPIPLRAKDSPVWLELQPLLDRAYDNGRYARRLNYGKPLDPPLSVEEERWVAETVGAAAKSSD